MGLSFHAFHAIRYIYALHKTHLSRDACVTGRAPAHMVHYRHTQRASACIREPPQLKGGTQMRVRGAAMIGQIAAVARVRCGCQAP